MAQKRKTKAELLEEVKLLHARLAEEKRTRGSLEEMTRESGPEQPAESMPPPGEGGRGEYVQVTAVDPWEKLQSAYEELQVAEEELRLQNEELAATRLEMEKERDRYQELFDSAPDGYIITDTRGIIHEANKMAEAMLNITRQNLFGKPLMPFIASENRKEFIRRLARFKRTGALQKWELSIQPCERALFHAELTAVRSSSDAGESIRWLIRDVTEQKAGEATLKMEMIQRRNAEEASKLERERIFKILEKLPVMVCLLRPDYQVVFSNRLFWDTFGEAGNLPCYEQCHKQPGPCEFCETFVPLETGEPHFWVVNALDGKIREVYDFPFTDTDGSPLILEMSVDVTERRQAEKVLAMRAQVDAALAEMSGALIRSLSLEEISNVVLKHARLLTESRHGFAGHCIPGTGHFVSATLTRDAWDECQVSGKSVFFENLDSRNGLCGWVWEHPEPLLLNNSSGDPRSRGVPPGHVPINRLIIVPAMVGEERLGMIAVANSHRDYTQEDLHVVTRLAGLYALAISRKQAEETLRESEARFKTLSGNLEETVRRKTDELVQAEHLAAIGRMVATVAHEVRNPIQIIRTGVDALRLPDNENEDEWRELLAEVEYGAKMLEQTISDLLQYARPLSLQISPAAVRDLVNGALKLVSNKLKYISTSLSLKAGDQEIHVDPAKFQQVLVNLMLNAADAMPGGGSLTIHSSTAERDGKKSLQISITDTGPGIDERHLDDIFQPFFTTKTRGTGLGLSLCKKIMDAHGGAIDITSKPGEGTIVELTLPNQMVPDLDA